MLYVNKWFKTKTNYQYSLRHKKVFKFVHKSLKFIQMLKRKSTGAEQYLYQDELSIFTAT